MNSKNSTQGNQAKGWFLTFPQNESTKEALLEECILIGAVSEYVIAVENHQDGTPHLHAFVKWATKKRFTQMKFTKHGNYQIAKSWKAVEAYCKKGGDYISNINVDAARQKQSKILKEDYEKDPLILLDEGKISFMQLNNFVKNQETYRMLKRKTERPPEKMADKKRHYWIYGPSNSGKTTQLREMMTDIGMEHFFQIPYNNDWRGYTGEKYLYADEYKGQLTIQELNRICDGGAKVNTKGGSAQLNWEPEVIILSNFSIEECYSKAPAEMHLTLNNRFNPIKK